MKHVNKENMKKEENHVFKEEMNNLKKKRGRKGEGSCLSQNSLSQGESKKRKISGDFSSAETLNTSNLDSASKTSKENYANSKETDFVDLEFKSNWFSLNFPM